MLLLNENFSNYENFSQIQCQDTANSLITMFFMSIFDSTKWAAKHFQYANLGDKRRTERLVLVASQMAAGSGKSLSETCFGDDAKLEGAYRLFRNEKVTAAALRAAGFEHTAQIAADVREILALEDTTSLSYDHSVAP